MDIGFHHINLPYIVSTGGQRIETSLYDKRSQELHMLPAGTFTHIHSHSTFWSKINTFYSQSVRIVNLVSNIEHFISAVCITYNNMLLAGHDKHDMWFIICKSMKFAAKQFCLPHNDVLLRFLVMVGDDDLHTLYATHGGRLDGCEMIDTDM
jgi:hypothetical protein